MDGRPRVLLVEDDTSLQRFVRLALEDLEIELLCCISVDEALAALKVQPVHLILTDLMLPGRSGFDLIQALTEAPALLGQARLVVFSAGLTPDVRRRLESEQVWQLLSKPCTVGELEACVREAVQPSSAQDAAPVASAAVAQAPDEDVGAVERHFGGNRALYLAFRASCLPQFVLDVQAGELAFRQHDMPALRRLAHSLKSVLMTLGHAQASELARQLEVCAEHEDGESARPLWEQLQEQMQSMD
jgi:CheY-like chemotaxis protein